MATSKTKYLEEKLEPILEENGLELVLLELKKQGKDWVLRVYIDCPDGVTLDLCEQTSRQVSEFLDEDDPLDHAYSLEVSSPGIERPLVKPGHFERFVGERVQIQVFRPVQGKKSFTGILKQFQDQTCVIENESDANTYTVTLEEISKANLKPILDFN